MIITIYSGKGGVGKSTTTATLAHIWRAKNPIVIDMDEQKATAVFAESLAGISRHDVESSDFSQFVAILDPRQLVIIDSPPLWSFASEAIRIADLVVIPCVTELLPFRATLATRTNVGGKGRILLTRYNSFDAEANEVRAEVNSELMGSVFKSVIPGSRAVRAATLLGQCVTEFEPESKAAIAYFSLAEEIEDYLKF
jgi:cellulose biosynthesis protein BcsQ